MVHHECVFYQVSGFGAIGWGQHPTGTPIPDPQVQRFLANRVARGSLQKARSQDLFGPEKRGLG